MHFFIVYFALGAIGGFLSGLLGIGGALVMIPLMLAVPPLAGLERISMQAVSGLSMVQAMFASLSGVLLHYRYSSVNIPLLWIAGISMCAASLAGAVASCLVSETALMTVFGVMLLFAGAMMFLPAPAASAQGHDAQDVSFRFVHAVLAGLGVGLVAGLVGAGGGFVLIPVLIYGLRIPVKVAIGTSLGIVLLGSVAGAVGKIATNQVHAPAAAALVAGSIIFAGFGAKVSQKTSAKSLRYLLALIVLVSAVQIWSAIFLRLLNQ